MSPLVLIADGDAERGKQIAERCSARGLECVLAHDGAAALERTLAEGPAALAAHVDLPLIRGVQLLEILEANPRTRQVSTLLLGDPGPARQGAEPGPPCAPDDDPDAAARTIQSVLLERSGGEGAGEGDGLEGMEGGLGELPLADLLQLFHDHRRTGTVEVTQRREPGPPGLGRIFLREGDVIQAVVGLVEGEKALYRLLSWDRGRFVFKPNPVTIAPRIETPTRALLQEGRRQLEERDRSAVELPPMEGLVRLRIARSRLPNVLHPLTQEVLVVLELYSRVREVVDHCSYPDYQVLRTLQALISRGLVELHHEPDVSAEGAEGSLFSPAHVERLREWLATAHPRSGAPPPAKLLVLSPDSEVLGRFTDLIGRLPGLDLDPRAAAGELEPSRLDPGRLGRLAVGPELAIDLVQLPASERFAPLWPLAAHGALATLVPLAPPVEEAAEAVRRASTTVRSLPGARLFYLLLLDRGDRAATDLLRENAELLDQGPLFLLPLENDQKAITLLREMFRRVLP